MAVAGCTTVPTKLSEPGSHAASPLSGEIVHWRVKGATPAAGYALSVLRPNGAGSYTVNAATPFISAVGHDIETFPSNLPIHQGELIALSRPYGARLAILESSSSEASFGSLLAIGQTRAAEEEGAFAYEPGFNADLQPPPSNLAIKPASGPTMGGTQVTITGSDLTATSAVSFGATPASSFTVNSEDQITATTPISSTPGPVQISVTTIAGTASASQQFTYTAMETSCAVPKLKGKSLKATQRALLNADCKLGRVKGKMTKSSKVTSQNPKPGASLTAGSKVNVTVK